MRGGDAEARDVLQAMVPMISYIDCLAFTVALPNTAHLDLTSVRKISRELQSYPKSPPTIQS